MCFFLKTCDFLTKKKHVICLTHFWHIFGTFLTHFCHIFDIFLSEMCKQTVTNVKKCEKHVKTWKTMKKCEKLKILFYIISYYFIIFILSKIWYIPCEHVSTRVDLTDFTCIPRERLVDGESWHDETAPKWDMSCILHMRRGAGGRRWRTTLRRVYRLLTSLIESYIFSHFFTLFLTSSRFWRFYSFQKKTPFFFQKKTTHFHTIWRFWH